MNTISVFWLYYHRIQAMWAWNAGINVTYLSNILVFRQMKSGQCYTCNNWDKKQLTTHIRTITCTKKLNCWMCMRLINVCSLWSQRVQPLQYRRYSPQFANLYISLYLTKRGGGKNMKVTILKEAKGWHHVLDAKCPPYSAMCNIWYYCSPW